MQLARFLTTNKDDKEIYNNVFRSFISISMGFLFLALVFDMFKWITFMVSAFIETKFLNEVEAE